MSESLSNFDNQDNSNSTYNERPVLLKVLCILSWIGSGFKYFPQHYIPHIINEKVKQEFF